MFWTGKAEVPLHRIVMEETLGRELRGQETVHHINGQRDDNRPSNLELWDHAQPHGQRVPDKIAWCIEYLLDHGVGVFSPYPPSGKRKMSVAPVAIRRRMLRPEASM